MPAPAKIFISYRRKDSQVFTDRIYERLAAHFGADAVFRDIQSIQYGEQFPDRLQQAVEGCQVMVAVIGSSWVTIASDNGQPRLFNPEDWVRREIEGALSQAIPVIPALLDETRPLKADQLPESLAPLSKSHCVQIRPGLDFDTDINRLIQRLEGLVGQPSDLKPGGVNLEKAPDVSQTRMGFYARQRAKFEEELAAVESDLSKAPREVDRLRLEKEAEGLLAKIDDIDRKLG